MMVLSSLFIVRGEASSQLFKDSLIAEAISARGRPQRLKGSHNLMIQVYLNALVICM